MNIETDTQGALSIVRLDGRLNADAANTIKPQMGEIIDNTVGEVLLNFEKVDFIDSTGLGLVVSIYRRLREKNSDLVICCLSPQAQTLFELTRMHRIFNIFETEDAAVEACK